MDKSQGQTINMPVDLLVKRSGGGYVLVCVKNFIPCTFLPGFAGETGLPADLYSRLRRFWFAYKRNGRVRVMFWCVSTFLYNVHFSRAARGTPACQRISTHGYGDFGSERDGKVGILFCCVSTFLYHEHFSRAARGKPACRRLSTCGCGNFGSYTSGGGFGLHTSGTGGWGFRFSVFQQLNSPRIGLPSCAGGTGFPAALYARLRRFLFAYKKNGKVGILFWCVSTLSYHLHLFRAAQGNRLPGGSLITVAAI